MCGRYSLTRAPQFVRAFFGYEDQPNFPPRYNIAPTQPVAVVIVEAGARRFRLMRWAFLPSWAKDPKDYPLVFNIRSEEAADKASFRNALRRRRALIPADAFYEWRRDGRRREPFLLRRRDGRLIGLAALWETWSAKDGSEIDTVAILTTAANAAAGAIHPRLPAMIEEQDFATWLDPDEKKAGEAMRLLHPPSENPLEFVRIGEAVNKVANDGPFVQQPVEETPRDAGAQEAAPKKKAAGNSPSSPDEGQGSLF